MRFRPSPGRFVAVALGVAGIATVYPNPVHAQASPSDPSPPFVGTWWNVDRPARETRVIDFAADGGFEQRQGDLDAASYRVEGDSIRLTGGTGEFAMARFAPARAARPRIRPFRIRGDTLRWGGDDATILRFGDRPADADDPLEGRWRYERHGGTFEIEFTADGRVVRWIVRRGRWTAEDDGIVVVRGRGPPVTSSWRVRDDLLTLSDASGLDRGTARFLRVEDPSELTFRSSLPADPEMVSCALVRAAAGRFLEERRMATFDRDLGVYGFYDPDADALRMSSAVLQGSEGLTTHVLVHLVAHALGVGPVPDEEWVAEEIARRCTG